MISSSQYLILSPYEPVILVDPGSDILEGFWPEWMFDYDVSNIPVAYVSLPKDRPLMISVPREVFPFVPKGMEDSEQFHGAIITRPPKPSPLGVMIPAGIYEAKVIAGKNERIIRLQRLVKVLPIRKGPRWCVLHLPTRARGFVKRRPIQVEKASFLHEMTEDEMKRILAEIYQYERLDERYDGGRTRWIMHWRSGDQEIETVFLVFRRGDRVRLEVEHAGFCIRGDVGTMTLSPFLLGVLREMHVHGRMLEGAVISMPSSRPS